MIDLCPRSINRLADLEFILNRRTAHQTQEALSKFASEYAVCLSAISGQIRGLEASIEAMSLSASATANDEIIKALQEQDQMLKSCLKVYEPALKKTSSVSGTEIKYAQALDRAKVFTGNIDYQGQEASIRIDKLEARDNAQMITGNISAAFASAWISG
ncbi:hypothetical protein BD289DRAFT_296767 [Coniella lustricola]|uniref:Fungal N-terminal domain-containing protein n=1 Tax=Coniella lustricola TaxID=2025994 RepID=A0A2T3A4L7_9PEZI|nr:hypothetical protein BD289DRAFT_296767 [Coniella lustricola]